jgi:hypothetical protein
MNHRSRCSADVAWKRVWHCSMCSSPPHASGSPHLEAANQACVRHLLVQIMCNSTIAAHRACTTSHSIATTISIHVTEWASESLRLERTPAWYISLVQVVYNRWRWCLIAHEARRRAHHRWDIGIARVLARRWHSGLRRRRTSLGCILRRRSHVEPWGHVRPGSRHTRWHTRLSMLHRGWWSLCRPARRRHTRRHLIKTRGSAQPWWRSMNDWLLLVATRAFTGIVRLFVIGRACTIMPLLSARETVEAGGVFVVAHM